MREYACGAVEDAAQDDPSDMRYTYRCEEKAEKMRMHELELQKKAARMGSSVEVLREEERKMQRKLQEGVLKRPAA